MKLEYLDKGKIEDAIEDFYSRVNTLIADLVNVVGGESYAIIRKPRKVGFTEYAFFYAADLHKLFQFALGEVRVSSSYLANICDNIQRVLTTTALGCSTIGWSDFELTALGLAVRAARARLTLRDSDDDGTISADAIAVLASIGANEMSQIDLKPLKGKKKLYRVGDVIKAFETENIAI